MSGHVTGQVHGGYPRTSKGQLQAQFTISGSLDFAKLNPDCHMNYSVIFTEISFYPETPSFTVILY